MQNQAFDYKTRKYNVTTYDNFWPKKFNEESALIKDIFGQGLRIEHVGSTSVPGMSGKPCIDMLVIVKSLDLAREHIGDIERAGYMYRGAVVTDGSLLFTKMEGQTNLVNIHVFEEGHPHVREMLQLREYLRDNPEEVARYSAFKRELYHKYEEDYAEYHRHKDEYMEKLKIRSLAANERK